MESILIKGRVERLRKLHLFMVNSTAPKILIVANPIPGSNAVSLKTISERYTFTLS